MENRANAEKISLREKLCYTCGNLGGMIVNTLVNSYLLIFYTDIFGLPAMAVGTLFLLARIWDAINDPVMGFAADHTRTRWGSYRPYLLFMAIPMGIICYLLFLTPDFSASGKMIYASVVYVLYGMLYTACYIPYGSMNNLMTKDPDQRVTLSAFREVGSSIGNFILGLCVVPLITYMGKGDYNNPQGWTGAAAIFAVFVTIFIVLSFLGTRERLPVASANLTLKQSFKALKSNKPLLILSAVLLLTGTAGWFEFSWFAYYAKYVLNDMSLMTVMMGVFSVFSFLSQVITQPLSMKLNKRNTMILGNAAFIVSGICYMLAGTNMFVVCMGMAFFGLGSGWVFTTFWGAMPDVVEYAEWKTGVRAPGFLYSCGTFSNKLSTGIGQWLATVTLTVINIVPNVQQSAQTIMGIRFTSGIYVAVTSLAAIVLLIFYPLDQKTFKNIVAELDERKANAQ